MTSSANPKCCREVTTLQARGRFWYNYTMFNNKVYHRIDALSGSVATLRAEGVRYGEIAEVASRAGISLAQVIKLDGDSVTLQIFSGARGVDTSAKVRFLGETMHVQFSDALLGRAFTGTGVPRDGGPAVEGEKWEIRFRWKGRSRSSRAAAPGWATESRSVSRRQERRS